MKYITLMRGKLFTASYDTILKRGEETIKKIKNASANGVVEVETRLFNSFGIRVRDALAERPNVTLKVTFLSEGYKGQLLKVTIPAGIDRKALFDEKGWLDLCRAGSTLGYDM